MARHAGSSGSGELVLSNLSAAPVTLSGIAATTADFGVWSGTGELVVPAATVGEDRVRTPGTAALPVLFTPRVLGPRAGAIQFSSGLPRQATNLAELLRQGRLVGDSSNPKVLTPVTPNVLSLFASKVNVGINGSATEVSAAAATAALTPPLIGAENAGLVRPDASLGVVILTDARDQSPQPVSYYVSALLGVKGGQRADLFSYSALVPTLGAAPSGCSYDDGSAASYPFHQQMVARWEE